MDIASIISDRLKGFNFFVDRNEHYITKLESELNELKRINGILKGLN